jgi:hypothetical protein
MYLGTVKLRLEHAFDLAGRYPDAAIGEVKVADFFQAFVVGEGNLETAYVERRPPADVVLIAESTNSLDSAHRLPLARTVLRPALTALGAPVLELEPLHGLTALTGVPLDGYRGDGTDATAAFRRVVLDYLSPKKPPTRAFPSCMHYIYPQCANHPCAS